MSTFEQGIEKTAANAGLQVGAGDTAPAVLIPSRDGGDLNHTANLLGEVIKDLDLFRLNNQLVTFNIDGEREPMDARYFRGWIMQHVVTTTRFDKDGRPKPVPLGVTDAATILRMPGFLRGVRRIIATNHVRLPVIRDNGELELLPWGHDQPTATYTVPGGIEYQTDAGTDWARQWIENQFDQFPFSDTRAHAVQVAAMLSLYIKHLLPEGCLRTGFLWLANKPGTGKSVLAKAALYPVLGRAATAKKKKGEELDKEFESFAIASAPYLFMDNVVGSIDEAAMDQMLTSEESTGRAMGGHNIFTAKNTMLLLITGNRLELSEDAQRRFLIIDLFEPGNPADRVIDTTLDDELMKKETWRAKALSAMHAIVTNWHACGCPPGETILPTYERLSHTLGGIVTAAGYADPMIPAVIPDSVSTEKAEFTELLQGVLEDMHGENAKDYTLEALAKIARLRDIFTDTVGSYDQGVKLAIREDGIKGEDRANAIDHGYLTQSQRIKWSLRLKKEIGGEPTVNGIHLRFGERAQSRKTTYTVTLIR